MGWIGAIFGLLGSSYFTTSGLIDFTAMILLGTIGVLILGISAHRRAKRSPNSEHSARIAIRVLLVSVPLQFFDFMWIFIFVAIAAMVHEKLFPGANVSDEVKVLLCFLFVLVAVHFFLSGLAKMRQIATACIGIALLMVVVLTPAYCG
jgi:hypothetical protein